LYAAVLECEDCTQLLRVSYLQQPPRLHVRTWLRMRLNALCARCPRCGSDRLSGGAGPDAVHNYRSRPVRTLQRLMGAPLCYCAECRLQFYDLRPKRHIES